MIRHFEKLGTFHKVEGDTAYGWALVSSIEGVPYFDTGDGTHSDHIPEESLPEVAAEFMKAYGAGLDMHKGDRIADVLFAYPMTTDIMKGVEVSSNKTGLLIGWQPYDKSILEKISDGERIGFSIGGLVSEWDIVDADGKVIETVLAAGKQAGKPFGLQLTKGYDGKGKMKRRVFRSWKLHEVSLVDRPMQEGALVGIVKSADGSVPYRKVRSIARAFSKGALLTSVVDGHQHVVDPACCDENGIGRTDTTTHSSASRTARTRSRPTAGTRTRSRPRSSLTAHRRVRVCRCARTSRPLQEVCHPAPVVAAWRTSQAPRRPRT
jgi:hypothetical protein